MTKKFCAHPGCHKLLPLGTTYCDKHAPLHEFKNPNWGVLYLNPLWKKMRREFLEYNPYCVICGAEATDVDHIIAHRGNEELFWDQSNWQSLCHSCHSKKTAEECNIRRRKDPY